MAIRKPYIATVTLPKTGNTVVKFREDIRFSISRNSDGEFWVKEKHGNFVITKIAALKKQSEDLNIPYNAAKESFIVPLHAYERSGEFGIILPLELSFSIMAKLAVDKAFYGEFPFSVSAKDMSSLKIKEKIEGKIVVPGFEDMEFPYSVCKINDRTFFTRDIVIRIENQHDAEIEGESSKAFTIRHCSDNDYNQTLSFVFPGGNVVTSIPAYSIPATTTVTDPWATTSHPAHSCPSSITSDHAPSNFAKTTVAESSKIRLLENEINVSKSKALEMESTIAQMSERITNLEAENQSLKLNVSEAEMEYATMEAEKSEFEKSANKKISQLLKANAKFEEDIMEFDAILSQKEKEIKNVEAKVEAIEAKLKESSSNSDLQIEQLQKALEIANRQCQKLLLESHQKNETLINITKECKEAAAKVKSLANTVVNLEKLNKRLADENVDAAITIDVLKEENQKQKEEIEKQQGEVMNSKRKSIDKEGVDSKRKRMAQEDENVMPSEHLSPIRHNEATETTQLVPQIGSPQTAAYLPHQYNDQFLIPQQQSIIQSPSAATEISQISSPQVAAYLPHQYNDQFLIPQQQSIIQSPSAEMIQRNSPRSALSLGNMRAAPPSNFSPSSATANLQI